MGKIYTWQCSRLKLPSQCYDIHLYNKASFPHFRWERGFDPLFDPAWKRSEWKQWKVYFRIVSKSYTIGQKRAGKCHLEFRTTSTITTPYPTATKPRFRRKAGTRLLTHILTQTAKILCGNSGENGAKRYLEPEKKGQNSAQTCQMDARAVAHNPEVAGSSPVSATIKVLKSCDFRTFSLFSALKDSAPTSGFCAWPKPWPIRETVQKAPDGLFSASVWCFGAFLSLF